MDDSAAQDEAPLKGIARIQAYLKTLPDAPGVYRMLDAKGDVLYVGKAKSLKKRVTSYAKTGGHNERISRMIADTAEMLFVTTASETEALLQEATEQLMRGRTVLVIAHRLATIYRADQVIVLKDGRVAERGTHDGLLERDGAYRELARAAMGG